MAQQVPLAFSQRVRVSLPTESSSGFGSFCNFPMRWILCARTGNCLDACQFSQACKFPHKSPLRLFMEAMKCLPAAIWCCWDPWVYWQGPSRMLQHPGVQARHPLAIAADAEMDMGPTEGCCVSGATFKGVK